MVEHLHLHDVPDELVLELRELVAGRQQVLELRRQLAVEVLDGYII